MTTRQQVLILVQQSVRGRALVEFLTDARTVASRAGGPDELRKLLNTQRVDVLVVEQALPGTATGLHILERIGDDLLGHQTVLLGELEPEERRSAEQLGVHCILPAQASMEEIREAVVTLLQSPEHRSFHIPEAARTLVRQADFIRPVPQLVARLPDYLENPVASLVDLARDISVDPKLAAWLLRSINDPRSALEFTAAGDALPDSPPRITSVLDAVNVLGIRRTINLIHADGLLKAHHSMLKPLPDDFRLWFHQRSVLLAHTAATFAGKIHGLCEDTAYLLGLLQELGMLVLAQAYGERYFSVVEGFRAVAQSRLHMTEQQQFGMTHADVSAALMKKWELPLPLIALVAAHHDASRLPFATPADVQYLDALQTAEAVADLQDLAAPHRQYALQRAFDRFGSHQGENCRQYMGLARARARDASDLFKQPLPDEAQLHALVARITRALATPASSEAPSEPSNGSPTPPPAPHLSGVPGRNGDTLRDSVEANGPLCILMIDDEPVLIKLVRAYLAPQGLKVVAGSNLEVAQALMPQAQAILCDVHLGEENGIDIVRRLRCEGFAGPIIMVSSDSSRTTVTGSIEAGIVDFLVKPITRDALHAKLRKHLGPAFDVKVRA